MKTLNDEQGSVLVFITLMIVLLMIMVGMGLDAGQLAYSRATGQTAVDAAALSAVSALPSRVAAQVEARAAAFNSKNNSVGSPTNTIGSANVSYVDYDFTTNQITNYAAPIATANGVRVALEQSSGTAIATPAFLTPLFKLFGGTASGANQVSVSAVSVITARPSIAIALWDSQCLSGGGTKNGVKIRQQNPGEENSCWTCYLDNSCGARDVKSLFQGAKECSGTGTLNNVDVGTKIFENKGQQASDYDLAYDFFFVHYPGREWLLPVIGGGTNCNEKNPTPIVDWAKIKVTEVKKNGAHSYIEASVTCGQKITSLDLTICHSHRLVREPAKGM